MIVDGIQIEEFNNQEYVLINKYIFKGERIYYFRNLEGEIYCTKEEDNFIPVTDTYKNYLLKNVLGSATLKMSSRFYRKNLNNEVYEACRKFTEDVVYAVCSKKVSPEVREKIIKEQKQAFRDAQERLGLAIDEKTIDQTLENVEYRSVPSQKVHTSGAYTPALNRIIYTDEVLDDWDDVYSARTRFHEAIHAHTGGALLTKYLFLTGLVEGQTESLTEDLYGTHESHSVRKFGKKVSGEAYFNFSEEASYRELVCIVKQMEAAIGNKSYESILNGDFSFEREFIKRYGLRNFIYLAGKAETIKCKILSSRGFKDLDLLADTQDKLLKMVFDKDIKDVQSIEDAENYFDKLRYFERLRAKVEYIRDDNKKYNGDAVYQEYYEQKYEEVKRALEEKGIPKEEIESRLEEYKYKPQFFLPEAEYMNYAKAKFAQVVYVNTKEGEYYDPTGYKLVKATRPSGRILYYVVKDNKLYTPIGKMDEGKGHYVYDVSVEEDAEGYLKKVEKDSDIEEYLYLLTREELEEQIENIIENEKESKKNIEERNNQSLLPVKKENIFKRIYNKIKSAFQRRKPVYADVAKPKIEDSSSKAQPTEKKEEYPSWDMRRFSKEEQERAKQTPQMQENTKPQEIKEDERIEIKDK